MAGGVVVTATEVCTTEPSESVVVVPTTVVEGGGVLRESTELVGVCEDNCEDESKELPPLTVHEENISLGWQ